MIKGSTYQEDIIINIFAAIIRDPEYVKQTVVIKFIQKESKGVVA